MYNYQLNQIIIKHVVFSTINGLFNDKLSTFLSNVISVLDTHLRENYSVAQGEALI